METIYTMFVLGTFTVRLGMLVAGVLFCWFGYRLFAQTNSHGRAEISVKDAFKLNLYHVGPGVFFSLFGAAILIYSIHKSPTLKNQDLDVDAVSVKTVDISSTVITGVGSESRILNGNARLTEAKEQIAFINRLTASGTVSSTDQNDLARLTREIKLSLMRSLWNPSWGEYVEFEAWTQDPGSRAPNIEARKIFER